MIKLVHNDKALQITGGNFQALIRRKFVSYIRTSENRKQEGYVVVVGMKNNCRDQCFEFDTAEAADIFHDDLLQLLDETKFYTYESEKGDEVSIFKSDFSFIRVIKNKDDQNARVVIIGLSNDSRDQHEFFDSEEKAENFVKTASWELLK